MILPRRAGGGGGGNNNGYPDNTDDSSSAQGIHVKSIYHLKQAGLVGRKILADRDTAAECRSSCTNTTLAASPARQKRWYSEDHGAMLLREVEAGGVYGDDDDPGAGVDSSKGDGGAGVVARVGGEGVVSLFFGRDAAAAAKLFSMSLVPAVCFGRGEDGESDKISSEEPRGAKVHEVLLSSMAGEDGGEAALGVGSMVRASFFVQQGGGVLTFLHGIQKNMLHLLYSYDTTAVL